MTYAPLLAGRRSEFGCLTETSQSADSLAHRGFYRCMLEISLLYGPDRWPGMI